ncbi:MAG: M48 family metallopeptidase [Chthoniobacterales bacterium]
MHRLILLCFALLVGLTVTGPAANVPETPPPAGAVMSADNPGAFDPAAATTAWLNSVPADKRAKSDAYFEGGYWLILWNFLLASAISILLLQTRISARLRDLAERTTRFKALQVVIYTIPYVLIVVVLSFGLTLYQGYFREHQYGLATQSLGPWLAERMKDLIVTLIGLPIALIILYAVLRKTPRTWWLWATVVVTCFQFFGAFIAPLYIEPLYNKYTPLTDATVRDPILTMARANQIPVKQVLVVDQSRQTTRISANVAGFLNTTRIALNDNLVKECSLPEIRGVMAHEMGHYVLNHLVKLVIYQSLVFFVAFAATAGLFNLATARWGERWGIRGIADPAGLPLLVLILNVLFFLLTPVTNTIVRTTEIEADRFGVNTSREPDGMARVFLKLGAYRKLNPTPLEEVIFFDHPSGRTRIRMAMDWKAAQLTCGEVRR